MRLEAGAPTHFGRDLDEALGDTGGHGKNAKIAQRASVHLPLRVLLRLCPAAEAPLDPGLIEARTFGHPDGNLEPTYSFRQLVHRVPLPVPADGQLLNLVTEQLVQ